MKLRVAKKILKYPSKYGKGMIAKAQSIVDRAECKPKELHDKPTSMQPEPAIKTNKVSSKKVCITEEKKGD